ncbi:MAG: hypothetical protein ABR977_02190 [Candidatus Dormibacteria bacterium]|jgi:hypothetical protein
MMSPYASLLIARERHHDLVRAAELSRLRRDAARPRASTSVAHLPSPAPDRDPRLPDGAQVLELPGRPASGMASARPAARIAAPAAHCRDEGPSAA